MMRSTAVALPVVSSQSMRRRRSVDVAVRRFPARRHVGEEALDHQFLLHADHAVVGAGHADVGLVGGAFGKNTRVGGGE